MDPVSNVDRLVHILRQRLAERSRPSSARVAGASTRPDERSAPAGLHALAGVDAVDERQFRRALVQGILTEQFGAELINDAKFQQVVSQVSQALEGDEASSRLLGAIASELRQRAAP